MFGRIKRRRTDVLFSKLVRERAGWQCAKCGNIFKGASLQVSHFWPRGKEGTRFDLENVDALCVRDHQFFETHRTEYEMWKWEQMGNKAYTLLMVRAHTPTKRDDKAILLWLKAEMGSTKL